MKWGKIEDRVFSEQSKNKGKRLEKRVKTARFVVGYPPRATIQYASICHFLFFIVHLLVSKKTVK